MSAQLFSNSTAPQNALHNVAPAINAVEQAAVANQVAQQAANAAAASNAAAQLLAAEAQAAAAMSQAMADNIAAAVLAQAEQNAANSVAQANQQIAQEAQRLADAANSAAQAAALSQNLPTGPPFANGTQATIVAPQPTAAFPTATGVIPVPSGVQQNATRIVRRQFAAAPSAGFGTPGAQASSFPIAIGSQNVTTPANTQQEVTALQNAITNLNAENVALVDAINNGNTNGVLNAIANVNNANQALSNAVLAANAGAQAGANPFGTVPQAPAVAAPEIAVPVAQVVEPQLPPAQQVAVTPAFVTTPQTNATVLRRGPQPLVKHDFVPDNGNTGSGLGGWANRLQIRGDDFTGNPGVLGSHIGIFLCALAGILAVLCGMYALYAKFSRNRAEEPLRTTTTARNGWFSRMFSKRETHAEPHMMEAGDDIIETEKGDFLNLSQQSSTRTAPPTYMDSRRDDRADGFSRQ